MARRRLALAGAVLAAVAALLFFSTARARRGLDPAELARRVEESRPTWQGYDEDIKAQLGAASVAEWRGRLVEVAWEPGRIRAAFELAGPWARRDIAIPILLHDAHGSVLRSSEAHVSDDGRVTYTFDYPGTAPPAWLELRYPFYGARRIVLSGEHHWKHEG